MAVSEQVLWEERPVLRDILFNPLALIVTVLPLGIPLAYIWLQRYFTRYTLTSERLIVKRGILSKIVDDVELYRIRDTRTEQTFWERLLDIGTIEVNGTDQTGTLLITKISNPHEKREAIRRLSEESKRQRNVRVIEN
jgi:uncharacterized membrane protein YdbT with pleckstrin-like domain